MIQTNNGLARTTKGITIPAGSQVNIEVHVSKRRSGDVVLLESSQTLHARGVAGARSLVCIKRGNAPIRLLNQTAKDVSYLPGHKVVAAICEIDETNIHAIDSAQNVPTCAYLKPCTTESAISHTNSVHVNIKLKIFEKGLSETERSELLQFFEEKKSNTFRFALDYRKLNQITLSISHPLPRLECIFDTIGQADAKIFSTLDLASGFWQIPMILKLAIKQLL